MRRRRHDATVGIPPGFRYPIHGPWRCAWRRRRPWRSAASAEGSSSVAVPRRLLPRIAVASREMCSTRAIHRPRRLMQTAGQTALGKRRKRPAKTSPRSEAGRHRSSRTGRDLKTLDQAARRRNVEHRLGYEGARQRRAVLLRPPYRRKSEGLDPHQFQATNTRSPIAKLVRASGTAPVERPYQ